MKGKGSKPAPYIRQGVDQSLVTEIGIVKMTKPAAEKYPI